MFAIVLSLGLIFALNFSGSSEYYSELYETITIQESESDISVANALSGQKSIAITFDDGPHPVYTREILDILDSRGVVATFFVLGGRIRGSEQILMRMKASGHEIGNHSYLHPELSKIPTLRYIFEVWRTAGMIWSVTGAYPIFFRFPYGAEDRRIGDFHSGPIIGWNVDAYDWKGKNPEKLTKNIIAQTKSGSIILLHDIKRDTVEALPLIIDGLEARGYRFVPLRGLIGYSSGRNYRNIIYRSATNTGVIRIPKIILPLDTPLSQVGTRTGSTSLTGSILSIPYTTPLSTLAETPPHE